MKHIFKLNTKKNHYAFLYSFQIFLFTLIFIFIFSCPVKIFSSQPYGESDIVSGVVPHHLLAEEMVDRFFKYISSQGKIENIILLSPDHFQSGILNKDKNTFITINPKSNKTLFSNISINKLLISGNLSSF